MTVEEKIRTCSEGFEKMPGITVIHEVKDFKPLFMTKNGLELLKLSLGELIALGAAYRNTFFKAEDLGVFLEKFQELIFSVKFYETFTFLHQVKYDDEFHWYAASMKTFHVENNRTTHTITYAVPLTDYPWTIKRAENLLQETVFARKNLDKYLQLSPREVEILPLVATGNKIADIAEKLKVSGNTINSHLKSIKKKLGTNSSLELLKFAKAYDLL